MKSITERKFGAKALKEYCTSDNQRILVSYQTPVVIFDGTHFYITKQKHSATTSKHINLYLREMPLAPVIHVLQEEIDSIAKELLE